MATIQLAGGMQIKGRYQESNPAGEGHWMQDDIVGLGCHPQEHLDQAIEEQGRSQPNLGQLGGGSDFGERYP